MEKDHHLADPGIHLGYRIRIHGHHALGESGTIRQPVRSFIIRWFVIRLHLYGDRLRNLADEQERMLVYGVGIGILTTVIRLFGSYPEGMSFAILIMNAFTPLINSYIKPKHFGGK